MARVLAVLNQFIDRVVGEEGVVRIAPASLPVTAIAARTKRRPMSRLVTKDGMESSLSRPCGTK